MRSVSKVWTDSVSLAKTVLSGIGQLILCIYFMLSVFFLVIHILGFQKYVVVSGSMLPSIPVGSCILVKEKEPSGIEPGEILTYYRNSTQHTVTHRVIENNRTDRWLITKGDANDTTDAGVIDYENCIGTVRLICPFTGYLLVILNSVSGRIAAAVIFAMSLWLTSLNSVYERRLHAKK